jgi:hypothetical protein
MSVYMEGHCLLIVVVSDCRIGITFLLSKPLIYHPIDLINNTHIRNEMSALCWCILALLSSNGRNRGMFRHIQLKVNGLEGILIAK